MWIRKFWRDCLLLPCKNKYQIQISTHAKTTELALQTLSPPLKLKNHMQGTSLPKFLLNPRVQLLKFHF